MCTAVENSVKKHLVTLRLPIKSVMDEVMTEFSSEKLKIEKYN